MSDRIVEHANKTRVGNKGDGHRCRHFHALANVDMHNAYIRKTVQVAVQCAECGKALEFIGEGVIVEGGLMINIPAQMSDKVLPWKEASEMP